MITAAPPLVQAPKAAATLPNLLIVDDEEGPRQSLRMVFKQDFQVHVFDHGDAALAFAREHPVHVAILDIRMAGKTGIEVLRELKEIDPHIEVLMLTAYETIETARQALRLGACDYLSKPFDLATIREAVGHALHLRRISETVSSTEERLKALSDQLHDSALREEVARTTSEIYAGALHDINNPLTIIAGYVDLLHHRLGKVGALHGADLDAVKQEVALLSKQVTTCSAIMRRYLRFVNKRSASNPEVSINQVIEDVQTLMRNHPSLRGGTLVVKRLDRDTMGKIGGTEMIQVLLNLTINAFQASTKPQTVFITAERFDAKLPINTFHDSPTERFIGLDSFDNTGPLAALSVIDQGPGIPRDVLSRIFEAYFTTKAEAGTGLGLAIVTRLVRHHHGLIHVKTTLGAGTCFTVYLPAKDGAPQAHVTFGR